METFERKETKYLLTPMQYLEFRMLLETHIVPAEYPEGTVTSVYYDTADDILINRSLQGGKYKEKLRVRSYGRATEESPVFVEIKKKFKGITYKRRVNCTLAAARAFLEGMDYEQATARWPLADARAQEAAHSATALQIAGEIAWMRDHYQGIGPKMSITTHRLSFVSADDPNLRITFDSGANWTRVEGGQLGTTHVLFPDDKRILEVKCSDAYPRWLVEALNECGIRPQSVSKYGRAYQASMDTVRTQAQAAVTARVKAKLPQAKTKAPAKARHQRGLVAAMAAGILAGLAHAPEKQTATPKPTRRPAHALR